MQDNLVMLVVKSVAAENESTLKGRARLISEYKVDLNNVFNKLY